MYEPEEPAAPIGHHLMKTVTESLALRAGCKAVKSYFSDVEETFKAH